MTKALTLSPTLISPFLGPISQTGVNKTGSLVDTQSPVFKCLVRLCFGFQPRTWPGGEALRTLQTEQAVRHRVSGNQGGWEAAVREPSAGQRYNFPPKKSCMMLSQLLSGIAKDPGHRGKELMH